MRSEIGCFDDVEETMFTSKRSRNSFKRDEPRKCIKASKKYVSGKKDPVYEQSTIDDIDFYIPEEVRLETELYLEDKVGLNQKQIKDLYDYSKDTLDFDSFKNLGRNDDEVSKEMKKYCRKNKIPPYDKPIIVMRVPVNQIDLTK